MICKVCGLVLIETRTPRTRPVGTKETRNTVLKCHGCGRSHGKEHVRILRRM
jgi:RNase P subunit RPR2